MRITGHHAPIIVVRWIAMELDSAAIVALHPLLDASEQTRAKRFHLAADRDAYIAAHALLRMMLSHFTGIGAASLRFLVGENGKPSLHPAQGLTDLQFSLSHTAGLVACAVGRRYPLGIDVEVWRDPAPIELAARYFAAAEARLVADLAPAQSRATFYRLWTLKEAYIKATGQGLAAPLQSFAFSLDPVEIAVPAPDSATAWQFAELRPSPVHSLALAVRSPKPISIDAASISLRDWVDGPYI